MDTLVSLGTGAAFLWSLYALFLGSAGEPGMTHPFELTIARGDGAADIYLEAAAGVTTFLLADRKSTRLNSSHANISYAVFCLKKKKTTETLRSSRNDKIRSGSDITPMSQTKQSTHGLKRCEEHKYELQLSQHSV